MTSLRELLERYYHNALVRFKPAILDTVSHILRHYSTEDVSTLPHYQVMVEENTMLTDANTSLQEKSTGLGAKLGALSEAHGILATDHEKSRQELSVATKELEELRTKYVALQEEYSGLEERIASLEAKREEHGALIRLQRQALIQQRRDMFGYGHTFLQAERNIRRHDPKVENYIFVDETGRIITLDEGLEQEFNMQGVDFSAYQKHLDRIVAPEERNLFERFQSALAVIKENDPDDILRYTMDFIVREGVSAQQDDGQGEYPNKDPERYFCRTVVVEKVERDDKIIGYVIGMRKLRRGWFADRKIHVPSGSIIYKPKVWNQKLSKQLSDIKIEKILKRYDGSLILNLSHMKEVPDEAISRLNGLCDAFGEDFMIYGVEHRDDIYSRLRQASIPPENINRKEDSKYDPPLSHMLLMSPTG